MAEQRSGFGLKHAAIAVGAATAVGAVAWLSLRSERIPIAGRAMMVDVASGQLFSMDVERKGLMVPERHPETGELSLMPVEQTEDGQWVIPGRMLGALSMVEVEASAVVDPRQGTLRVSDRPVMRARPRPAEGN